MPLAIISMLESATCHFKYHRYFGGWGVEASLISVFYRIVKCCNHISLNISVLWDVTLCCLIYLYTRLTEEHVASVLYLIHRSFYHQYSSNPRRCLSTWSSPRETFKHLPYILRRKKVTFFVRKSVPLSFCLEIDRREHLLFRVLVYLFKVNFAVL